LPPRLCDQVGSLVPRGPRFVRFELDSIVLLAGGGELPPPARRSPRRQRSAPCQLPASMLAMIRSCSCWRSAIQGQRGSIGRRGEVLMRKRETA
jgi:hypothetical protein